MSAEKSEVDTTSSCASCGMAENNDIKMKNCTACYLVKYCSVKCQKEHRSKHKKACKQRAAELRDDLLFKQPDSTYPGDCPICFLPMPIDMSKHTIMLCCSKLICNGCNYASTGREVDAFLDPSCPFCRTAFPKSEGDIDKRRIKRVEVNDPVAMYEEGIKHYDKGDYISAFEYWTKAAQLGDISSHSRLTLLYHYGHGVQKDEGKFVYHLEEASIGGHAEARYNLGIYESNNGNTETAVKHWIIAATQGLDDAMKALMDAFKDGYVSKEDLAATLRAHQAAVDAWKSPQREKAEDF